MKSGERFADKHERESLRGIAKRNSRDLKERKKLRRLVAKLLTNDKKMTTAEAIRKAYRILAGDKHANE